MQTGCFRHPEARKHHKTRGLVYPSAKPSILRGLKEVYLPFAMSVQFALTSSVHCPVLDNIFAGLSSEVTVSTKVRLPSSTLCHLKFCSALFVVSRSLSPHSTLCCLTVAAISDLSARTPTPSKNSLSSELSRDMNSLAWGGAAAGSSGGCQVAALLGR